ncbi:MAG: hypothetical protein O2U61_00755, partial [Candidatus Bathyarchaeota archaeon]|nr:hypothetical protein [Candidatus Bathyarchaeota archaeon]
NNFKFYQSSLDNSLSKQNYSVIRTYGHSYKIEVHYSELRKGLGGVYFDGINGSEFPILSEVNYMTY